MAFGSISKYTKIVQEKGITQQSVAEKSTKAIVDTEKAASIFNEDGSAKTSGDLSSPSLNKGNFNVTVKTMILLLWKKQLTDIQKL